MTTFHNRTSAIECADDRVNDAYNDRKSAYRAGHRHALHAAAEIANEADALIAELYSALRAIQANFNEQTIARAREAMSSYHEESNSVN